MSRAEAGTVGVVAPQEVGRRLRAYRTALGLTPADFADLVDERYNQVIQWETGKSRPSYVGALKIFRATGMSADYLYFGDMASVPPKLLKAVHDALAKRDKPAA